ncbi:hypothetical protein Tsubulata_019683 [Turnera subulata]|uniref:Splicing factor cactin central domain-containing protein n=1 Tax=Turnera subulata TaxID=218843 RepID=A0A9Q0JCM9_9ROSI|nr:hypothetical protein Tsubulata_019683 [Turnera subulata]
MDSDESPSESESESESYSDESPRRSSRRRECRSRSRGSSSRRHRSSHESDESDSGGSGRDRKDKKRRSSSDISKAEINEYLAKKAQRKYLNTSKKLKTHSVSGYSNDSNPFGDSNLNEKFVWRKKIERDVSQGVPLDTFSVRAEKKKQKERMAEIEKVKKRREETALEKARHEEEMLESVRGQSSKIGRKKKRSEIRLREGRMKPIDILSKHLNVSDDGDKEINEPYMVFKAPFNESTYSREI